MATAKENMRSFELDPLERAWVKRSLENQCAMIRRALQKEIPGSEIYNLRQREIAALVALGVKFDG